MVPKVLYNSGAIRKCIHSLLAKSLPSDRRVVLVAYIGQDYAKYLPDLRGIEIICSPTAGATSVAAVTELQEAKALIKFSDKLHMKVYWSAKRGCLITSANLSTNALGIKGLKEAGVLLDATAVNIDQLLKEAKPYAVTNPRLKQLKQGEDKFKRAMAAVGKREPQSGFQYLDWHKLKAVARTEWKLGYFEVTCDAADIHDP
jgi:phosphatidylserine/phosphatidylglycerophosphate/cardiolipin synthase-like enzyme